MTEENRSQTVEYSILCIQKPPKGIDWDTYEAEQLNVAAGDGWRVAHVLGIGSIANPHRYLLERTVS